jgi:hypothetical protein
MKTTRPDLALERVLAALERDLIDATDEEILAEAKELGMNPAMKGSAAFFGVTLLARPRPRPTQAGEQKSAPRARRRPKGDAPPST